MPSTSSSETWRHRIGWAKVTLFTFSWRNVRPKMQQSFNPLPSSVAFQMFNTYIANEENGTTKDFANKILSNQGRETLELWWQIRKCHILCLQKAQPAVVFTIMPHSWHYNFSWILTPCFPIWIDQHWISPYINASLSRLVMRIKKMINQWVGHCLLAPVGWSSLLSCSSKF